MEEARPASPEVHAAQVGSVLIVITGMSLQQLMAPHEAAWGTYELAGFALASAPWLVLGVLKLAGWARG